MVGETGGMWWKEILECSACAAVIVHDVMEKIGSLRESWRIERMGTQPTANTTLHCPECDGLLASAEPPWSRPAPVTSFEAERAAVATREIDHACVACGLRYRLNERAEVTWRNAEDRVANPSPLADERSR